MEQIKIPTRFHGDFAQLNQYQGSEIIQIYDVFHVHGQVPGRVLGKIAR